jgi:hypothetical protein
MSLRKLGVVREIIETAGMNISHAYDDLVFLDHNAFLLQFTDEDDKLLLHSNHEADKAAIKAAIAKFKAVAQAHAMTFIDGCDYSLSPADDENLRLEFMTD